MTMQTSLEGALGRIVQALILMDNKIEASGSSGFTILTVDPENPADGAAWILQQDKTVYECVGFMGAMPIMHPTTAPDFDYFLCIKTPSTIKRLAL